MAWWERFRQAFLRRTAPEPRQRVTSPTRVRDERAPEQAEIVAEPIEPQPRRIQLGIDFGTCWSKIVLRDYAANTPRAFVVRAASNGHEEPQFRIPSDVLIDRDNLYFGWP